MKTSSLVEVAFKGSLVKLCSLVFFWPFLDHQSHFHKGSCFTIYMYLINVLLLDLNLFFSCIEDLLTKPENGLSDCYSNITCITVFFHPWANYEKIAVSSLLLQTLIICLCLLLSFFRFLIARHMPKYFITSYFVYNE